MYPKFSISQNSKNKPLVLGEFSLAIFEDMEIFYTPNKVPKTRVFIFLQFCDMENLAKLSQKIGKLVEFALENKNFPNVFSKKRQNLSEEEAGQHPKNKGRNNPLPKTLHH
jgi:hypothetical protein